MHVFLGAYVPLTIEGNIIVDGILTSCYADFVHDLANLVMLPIQRFPTVVEWIFGDDIGFAVYVSTARELGLMLLPAEHFWNY